MTLSQIQLDSPLSSYFHPDELEVILSEIFYLPFFLRQGDISTVADITKYSLMEPPHILTRMGKINQLKPSFVESRDATITIKLNALLQDKVNLVSRILEFKTSQLKYHLVGSCRKKTFSASMYLIEEGVQVVSYWS